MKNTLTLRVRYIQSLAIIVLLYLLTSNNITAAQSPNWGPGPIELENQYPLHQFHSSWAPRSPSVIEEGALSAGVRFALSNTAIIEDGFQVDAETRNLYGDLTFSPLADTEVSLSLPVLWRGDGFLDSFIESWHDFWGLPGGDRNNLPQDSYSLNGTDQERFAIEKSGPEIGSIVVGGKYLITPGTLILPAWAAELEIGLPSLSDGVGHSGVDLTLGLIGSKRWSNWSVYFGVSEIYSSDTMIEGMVFETNHAEGFIATEYMIFKETSVYTAMYAGSQIIESPIDHPNHFLYIDLGSKIPLSKSTQLEILFRENPSPGDGSTDVTFLIGFASRVS